MVMNNSPYAIIIPVTTTCWNQRLIGRVFFERKHLVLIHKHTGKVIVRRLKQERYSVRSKGCCSLVSRYCGLVSLIEFGTSYDSGQNQEEGYFKIFRNCHTTVFKNFKVQNLLLQQHFLELDKVYTQLNWKDNLHSVCRCLL